MGQQGLDVRRACLRPSQLLGADFAVCRESYLEEAVEEEGDEDDLEAPSNAIKLSYDIARLCNVKITQAIQISQQDKERGEKLRKETKRFMEVFKYNWATDVKKRARHVLRERKLNVVVELPDPQDIATLAQFMQKKMENSKEPKTAEEFKELQLSVLARLISFNRRRPGELQQLRYVGDEEAF